MPELHFKIILLSKTQNWPTLVNNNLNPLLSLHHSLLHTWAAFPLPSLRSRWEISLPALLLIPSRCASGWMRHPPYPAEAVHRKHYFTCQYIGRNLQWLTYGLHNPLVPAKRYKRLEGCIMSHFLSPSPVMVCWENMWRVTAYCVMMRGPSEGGWETDSTQWAVKKRNRGSRKEKRWGEEKGRACSQPLEHETGPCALPCQSFTL